MEAESDLASISFYGGYTTGVGVRNVVATIERNVVMAKDLACPPKIGPPEMRDSCRITTGGSNSENKKAFGGAGISDSPRG